MHRVLELIPVLGSQPADDVNHKPGGRLPLLSARPAVTPAALNMLPLYAALWTACGIEPCMNKFTGA